MLWILGLKQHSPCQCIQKRFLGQIMGNSPEIIHLDPEPKKVSEHGPRCFCR